MDAKKRQILIEIFDLAPRRTMSTSSSPSQQERLFTLNPPTRLKGRAAEKRRLLQPGGSSVEITIQA